MQSTALSFLTLLVASTALAQGAAAPPPSAPGNDSMQGIPVKDAADPAADESGSQAGQPMANDPMELPPGFEKVDPLSKQWKPEERSPDAIVQGTKVLSELVKAYTAPVALEDKVALTMKIPGSDRAQELSIAYGPNGAAQIKADGTMITRLGDELYFEVPDAAGKYLKLTEPGSFGDAISSAFGGSMMPLPEIQLRGGDASKVADAIGSMFVANPVVVGFRNGSNGAAHVVLMQGDEGGEIEVSIDAKHGRLSNLLYSAVPPGAPEGLRIAVVMAVDSTAYDTDLPTPITFAAHGRKEVDSIDKLQMSLDIGSPALAFSMKDTAGTEVSLASLKGSVIVLDFWATWCGPCIKGLPKVNEFAQWAAASGKPIKVFGINTMEEDEGPADRLKKVGDFWAKKAFVFSTLIDTDNEVAKAYGVQGIPFTVIISPQGTIADVHMGLSPTLLEDLKKSCEAALRDPAAPADSAPAVPAAGQAPPVQG